MYRVSKAKGPLVWVKIANNRAFVQSFATYHSEVQCIKAQELKYLLPHYLPSLGRPSSAERLLRRERGLAERKDRTLTLVLWYRHNINF